MVWKGNAVTFRYMHSDWVVTCHFFRVLTSGSGGSVRHRTDREGNSDVTARLAVPSYAYLCAPAALGRPQLSVAEL